MNITVKLAGPLRKEVDGLVGGEKQLVLAPGTTVSEAVEQMGLEDKVRMLMVNGRPLLEDRPLVEGERLFLIPPELAYNMYVATGFLSPKVREKIRANKLPNQN